MKEEYHKWNSYHFDKEFEMLVFGHSGYPVIIFPDAGRKYFDVKNLSLIESCKNLLESGHIKIYCPDTHDNFSWLNYSIEPVNRIRNYLLYEKVVLYDIIEFAKYESGFDKTALCGYGFGAFHALNIGCKHPDKCGYIFCLNGKFDVRPHIFGYYDEDIYFNNPVDYLPNLADEYYLNAFRSMGIVLGVNRNSSNFSESKLMSEILNRLEVPHWFDTDNSSNDIEFLKNKLPYYFSQIELILTK